MKNSPGLPVGDVVISIDTALRQAREYRVAPASRLRRLLVHGFLHLIGYDHERSPSEARRMFARERALASKMKERTGADFAMKRKPARIPSRRDADAFHARLDDRHRAGQPGRDSKGGRDSRRHPDGSRRAPGVCMFDVPIAELRTILDRRNRRRYEPFGIAVDKRYAFTMGARPVIYMPWREAEKILAPEESWRVVSLEIDKTPPIDWSFEREWRVAGDLAVRAAAGGRAGRDLARRRRDLRPLQRPAAMRRRDSDSRDVCVARLTMSSNNATRAALAVASGLALGLAFPKFDTDLLAWVALVPLLLRDRGREHAARVLVGMAAGLRLLRRVALLDSDPAARLRRRAHGVCDLADAAAGGVVAIDTAVAIWAGEFVARRMRLPIVVTMPIAWTAIEWLRTYFSDRFPWNLLGYTAYRNLELIQFAEFTGVYGVSALIVFFNAVVYIVLLPPRRHRLQTMSLSALTA